MTTDVSHDRKARGTGCLKALGALFSPLAYVGGLVLAAWALHGILNATGNLACRITACIAGILTPWIIARTWRGSTPQPLRVTMSDASAGLGSLIVAGGYLLTWAKPSAMGETSVEIMCAMLVLEFILIHSAPFLAFTLEAPGALVKRILITLGLSLLYALFPIAMFLSLHTWTPFVVFSAMLISKFLAYFFHPLDAAARTMREERWTFAAFCYMGCAFMSVLIPMPRLGAYSLSGNGIWQQLPERALCAAAVYFSLLGFYELYFHSRKPK